MKNIITYIQSGNVIFQSGREAIELEELLENRLAQHFGFAISVLIRSIEDWEKIVAEQPFGEKETFTKNLYYTFLKSPATAENLNLLASTNYPPDRFTIKGQEIYLYCESYGKTKLSNPFFETKLKVKATTRNYNTLLKLLELAEQ